MTQDMTVDEALLVADGLGLPGAAISGDTTKRALDRLAAEVRRQHAELESLQEGFELLGLARNTYFLERNSARDVVRQKRAEIERLQAQLDASRRDAERAAGTASKLADQRLVTGVEIEAEAQRWLDKVNAEVESNLSLTNWPPGFGAAVNETRLRDFIDATVGVKP